MLQALQMDGSARGPGHGAGRRLSTLASFYRCFHQEGLVDANPALNVRRSSFPCVGQWARGEPAGWPRPGQPG